MKQPKYKYPINFRSLGFPLRKYSLVENVKFLSEGQGSGKVFLTKKKKISHLLSQNERKSKLIEI